jgi:hypothetical protein
MNQALQGNLRGEMNPETLVIYKIFMRRLSIRNN